MPLVNSYVSIPWMEGARGPTHYDCLGLLLKILDDRGMPIEDPWIVAQERLEAAPDLSLLDLSDLIPASWSKVAPPYRALDVAMYGDTHGFHVIIVGEGGWALTTAEQHGSYLVPLSEIRDKIRQMWRPAA